MGFTTLDKKYEKVVTKDKLKKQNVLSRKLKEKKRVMNNNVISELDADWEDLSDDDDDEDIIESPKNKKARYIPVGGKRKRARQVKGRRISLNVPVNIIQQTAVDAAILQLTPSQHQGIIAAFINVSGGNVEEFPISDTSARRDRKSAFRNKRQELIDNFKESVVSGKKRLIGHFDGKMMKELMDNNMVKVDREKEDRMAVFVTSPDLIDKEQLLGIPALKDGTGKRQQMGVMKLLKE